MKKGMQTLVMEKDQFNLPCNFKGNVSQALRILANHLEDNKESKCNMKIKEIKDGKSC